MEIDMIIPDGYENIDQRSMLPLIQSAWRVVSLGTFLFTSFPLDRFQQPLRMKGNDHVL